VPTLLSDGEGRSHRWGEPIIIDGLSGVVGTGCEESCCG